MYVCNLSGQTIRYLHIRFHLTVKVAIRSPHALHWFIRSENLCLVHDSVILLQHGCSPPIGLSDGIATQRHRKPRLDNRMVDRNRARSNLQI
jgi:hypothetical protein